MRILCLDVGTKRIGVAVSDPLGLTAQGVAVIARRGKELGEIADTCRELGAEKILIGLPLDEEGNEGPSAKKAKIFAGRLETRLRAKGIAAPIEFWDERYSTATAEERLIGANVSRAKRKKVIDKMAAVVILESYLSEH